MNRNKVIIVDDDQDFRESLAWLLESAGIESEQYQSAESFLSSYQGEPACLLLDVRMTGMSGLALQQQLAQRNSPIPIVLITGHGDVPMAVEAIKNGAVDFITKPFDDQQLLDLIETILAEVEQRFADAAARLNAQQAWQQLSPREKQLAELVIQGDSNRNMAEKLNISVKTVEIHRSRVMKKMQADSLANLIYKLTDLKR